MYGLTKPQKLIYDMEKYSGGAIAVVCGCVLRKGCMEIPAMKAAISEIIRINDALRTQIIESNGEVTQRIAPFTEQDFEVLHFTDKADLDDYSDKYAKQPLSLYGTLYEVKIVFLPDQYGILVKLHHIISDAWTISLFGTQFFSILDGTPPKAYPYEGYAKAEKEYLTGVRYAKDREFFLEQFKKCDEVTYLSEKQSDSLRAVRKTFVMDTESSRAITEYAKAHHTSPFVLFMSALAIYISRIKMNAERFYIGTAVLNRMGTREKNTMGMFINTVPLLIELDNTRSFAENVEAIGRSTLPLFRHQKYNYGDVLADIRKEFGFGERLYDVMLSYQNATIDGGGNTESTWYHNGVQTESLQMHIDDRDSEGYFRILYDYQMEKFTGSEIEQLHTQLCNLLLDGVERDGKKLFELKLLSTEEQRKLLFDFNDTAVDYPRDKCVHTLFEEQVAKTPDKTAVIACDKTLTYAELNAQANRIAHGLIERGIGIGDIVAFTLPRRSYLLATMLGILKSGAAYLPIDPDYPQDRIDYILSDSGAKLFITEEIVQHLLDNKQKSDPAVSITSDSLCYCIYTSGSTGRPKGTLLTHRNVGNYVNNNNNNNVVHRIIKSNFDWVVSVTTVGFDIFVTESLLPLANGMSILLADEKQANSQLSLAELLHLHRNDVLQTTPTKMKMLISDRGNTAYLQGLKAIILGGEALDKALVQELKQLTEAKIYNIYGPTETTVWSSNTEAIDDDITIGKPIANTQIYILDKYMQPVPIGVTGELCIAGDGVGAGYLNRPELTAERFVDNPFGAGKLYKTGDLAYWREDGNIVYVGRNDFQVKIRGLRIELGEIENAILAINGISQAVAVVRKDESGRQLICAFYTGAELPAKEIRSVIGQKLPKYMLPHVITHLDTLPLTTSGKINRKALPEVDLCNLDSETEYVAPVGELEMKLSALMEQILQVSPIGRDDDFFDLGGDSLQAIELIAEAHSEGIYLELQSVFDRPTVRRLAETLTESEKDQVSYTDVDFTDINRLLAGNTISQIGTPSKATIGNMLLAGATGFLGVHLLADFLDHENGIAYCLIRGKDQANSEARLTSALQFYFGETYSGNSRIRVICADLQKEHFGLSSQAYEQLLTEIDTVINAAATVKHYGSYQFFYETNVETVKRMIDCCMVSGAKLIQISTHSISGDRLIKEEVGGSDQPILPFYESDLYIGQSLDNVYIHSKFEAEKLVLDAMSMGLKANIMRMGNLTNRMSDGLFQKNYTTNAFLRRLKAFVDIRLFPDYLIKHFVEFTPVDEAARAIMTITRHFSEGQTVFHICSDKLLPFDTLLEYLRELGYPINAVDGVAFADALRKTAYQPDRKYIFETFADEMDENENLVLGGNIYVDNSFTVEYLRRLGFEWGKIDLEYLRQYMDYFKRLDYWG